jgi:hypothetical protein
MTINASDILGVTTAVTKKWTKQRKAEERGRSRSTRQYVYSSRVCCTDVAHSILPGAYDHASGGGKYTVAKRQLYYACRDELSDRTGQPLDYGHFASDLLVKYLNRHRGTTKSWKITADPRGTFSIPNAGHEVRIPCGTIQVENHLNKVGCGCDPFDIDATLCTEWPSLAGGQRYQAVLYIEKEGFDPMMAEAKIAERFDIATLSCKGQSVVAARRLVDHVCRVGGGVPLFVVHDFDKSGFEISKCLTTVSKRAKATNRVTYRFQNKINVTDLGLRMEDVDEYDLAEEACEFKGGLQSDSICSEDEKEFLRSGSRVELNAFTAPQFIKWIETKLTQHGLGERLIPDDAVLADAYRRALAIAEINTAIEEVSEQAIENAKTAEVPEALRKLLRDEMEKSGSPATWDMTLYEMAKSKLFTDDED